MIIALLLYRHVFDNLDDCRDLFTKQRGVAVSQPCQLRYLDYFNSFIHGQVTSPSFKRLKKVTLITVPYHQRGGCQPCFDLYRCRGTSEDRIVRVESKQWYTQADREVNFKLSKSQKDLLCGDYCIQFRAKGAVYGEVGICRVQFNTAFIQDNMLVVGKSQVSPEGV